jgi:ElaB/YqjD/DUF883 family membrane-anchored ribosome-binding protein
MKDSKLSGSKPGTSAPADGGGDLREKAGKLVAQVGDTAQEVAEQARQSAASLAAEANQSIKGLLNNQLTAGADLVGEVAQSARAAAVSLDESAPQIAGLVRNAARHIESFSEDLRGRSIEELVDMTTGYARRQPLVLFGAAAAFGFLAFRVIKSTPPQHFTMGGATSTSPGAPPRSVTGSRAGRVHASQMPPDRGLAGQASRGPSDGRL